MSTFCTNCGRELEKSWNICPDCGKSLKETTVPQTHPTTHSQLQSAPQTTPPPHRVQPYRDKYTKVVGETKFGTIALACGIIWLIFGFFYGSSIFGLPLFRILAIILGGIGISRDDNKTMAIGGLILGIIGLVAFLFGGFARLL
ncbi:MAG: zinc ribbon domain-containing protein [Candidatus Lokiarchaeota archaeon]|nr:zinc ribbon domain-containing protein [Candidatus Lokiarchaeota archaeon]